jgi:hypothetical protein
VSLIEKLTRASSHVRRLNFCRYERPSLPGDVAIDGFPFREELRRNPRYAVRNLGSHSQ